MSQPPDNPPRPAAGRRPSRWRIGCAAAAVAGLLALLLFLFLPRGPQHLLLAEGLERVLEQQTQRDVRLGRVSGSLWSGLTIRDLRIAGEGGFDPQHPERDFASVERLTIRYNLLGLLLRRADAAAAIRSIRLEGPRLRLLRRPDGTWEIFEVIELPKPEEPRRPFTFGATVTVVRGAATVIDQLVGSPEAPHVTEISGIEGEIDFNGRRPAAVQLTARSPGTVGLAGTEGSLTLDPRVVYQGRLQVQEAQLQVLRPYLNPLLQPDIEVLGGEVSVNGPILLVMAEREARPETERDDTAAVAVGLALTVRLAGASGRLRQLSVPVTGVTGTLTVRHAVADPRSPVRTSGADIEALALTLGGTRAAVSGRFDGFTDPAFDLHIVSDQLRLGEAAKLVPELTLLRPLRGAGTSRADVRVRGRLADLRLTGTFDADDVQWGDLATLRSGRYRLDLQRAAPGQGVAGVRGTITAVNGVVATRLLRAPLTRLNGTLVLLPDTLGLRPMSGLVGSAPLRLDGWIRRVSRPAERVFDLRVAVSGLDPMALAPLLPAPVRPRSARGTLAADLRLRGPLRGLAVSGFARLPWIALPQLTHLGGEYRLNARLGRRPTGTVQVRNAGLDVPGAGGPITAINGTLALTPQAVLLQRVSARVAGGPVRVDGRVSPGFERFDLSVWTPGIELAAVTGLLRRPGVSGQGLVRAQLRLRGTLDRFRVTGTALVPRLRVPGVLVRAANLTLNLDVVPRLGAARLFGSVVARDTEVVPRGYPAVRVEQGRLVFAGRRVTLAPVTATINGDTLTARGTVSGLPRVGALDLTVTSSRLRDSTLRLLAPRLALLRQVRLARPVAVDLRLRGTLASLAVRGSVNAPQVVLRGTSPTTLGGRLSVDLALRPRARVPVLGTATIRGGFVSQSGLGLAARSVTGTLRFERDGRIYVAGDALRGVVGESAFALRGSVGYVGREPTFDLTLSLPRLRLEDVRAATAPLEGLPELAGEGDLAVDRLRVTGPLSRLRIATGAAGSTVPGSLITVPPGTRVAGYTVLRGAVGFDVVLADGALSSGDLWFGDSLVVAENTGTRIALEAGRASISRRGIEAADVRASVGGAPITVTATTNAAGELGARVQAVEVSLYDLMPSLADQRELLGAARMSSDLTVAGPLSNLAVSGLVLLATAPELEPLRAAVHLRVVQPGGRGSRVLLGGVRLEGGELAVASLARPVSGLTGGLTLAGSDLVLEGLGATVAGQRVALSGVIHRQPDMVFDLRADLDAADLGAVLADLRLAPADGDGPRVDPFTRFDLPRLHTPGATTGSLTLVGPREQVTVAVDLLVPLVTVDSAWAVTDDRGLATTDPAPPGSGAVLARGVRVSGSAVGALPAAAEALPTAEQVAAALLKLAAGPRLAQAGAGEAGPALSALARETERQALELAQAQASPPQADSPGWLERFMLGLRLDIAEVHPRQALAFLEPEQRESELLASFYAYQPGSAALRVLGPARAPELTGLARLQRIELQGVPVRSAAVAFGYFEHVATFTRLDADIRGGRVTGTGAAELRPGQPIDLVADLDLDNLELAVLNALDLDALGGAQVEGLLNGNVQLRLAREEPRVVGAVTLTALSLDGERVGDGVAEFGFEDQTLVLRRAVVANPEQQSYARTQGRVELAGNGPLDLVVDVRNFELARLAPLLGERARAEFPLVTGRLDVVGSVTGTRQFPIVTGAANVYFGSVNGYPFNRLSVFSRRTSDRSVDLRVDLSDPAYRLTASGALTDIDVAAGSAAYALDFDLEGVNLGQALPLVSPTLANSSGTVSGRGAVRGRTAWQTLPDGRQRRNALLDLTGYVDLAAGDEARPGRLVVGGVELDTARLRLAAANDAIEVEQLELRDGRTRLGLRPGTVNRITDLDGEQAVELHLVSSELRYEDIIEVTRVPLQTEGYLTASADVGGTLERPTADVTLETHDLAVNGEVIGDRRIRLAFSGRGLELGEPQVFELFGTRLVLAGSVTEDRVATSVTVDVDDFERLRTFLLSLTEPVGDRSPRAWQISLRNALQSGPGIVEGELHAEVRLVGSLDDPRGVLIVQARDLVSRRGPAAGQTGPVVVRPLPDVDVGINLGTPADLVPETFEDGTLYVFGSADLPDGGPGALRLRAQLDNLDLAPFETWSPDLAGLRGRLGLRAGAGGSFRSPVVQIDTLQASSLGVGGVSLAQFSIEGLRWHRVGPGDERLNLGVVQASDRSLQARLTGELPVVGTSLQLRPSGPLALQLAASVEDLSQLGPMLGSVGELEGRAVVGLAVGGTPRNPLVSGGVTADVPRLQIVRDEPVTAPEALDEATVLAGLTGQPAAQPTVLEPVPVVPSPPAPAAPAVAGEPAAEPAPANRVVLYDLADLAVDVQVVSGQTDAAGVVRNNLVVVRRLEATSLPPAGDPAGVRGQIAVEPGSQVELRYGSRQQLFRNPAQVRLTARDFGFRQGLLAVTGLDADVSLQPVFQDRVLSRLTIQGAEAWVNGGLVRMGGVVDIQHPDPAQWSANAYQVAIQTPTVLAGSVQPPAGASAARADDGGVVYPLRLMVPRVGDGHATLDLRLVTREGQTPPLTLTGEVNVFDSVVREGVLGLLLQSGGPRQAVPWPASPRLDVRVNATENNWVRAQVPLVLAPWQAVMTVSETPQRLRVDGRLDIGQGTVSASVLRQEIRIVGGHADISLRRNPATGVFDPFISVTADAETTLTEAVGGGDFQSFEVDLAVTGTVRPGAVRPSDWEFDIRATSRPYLPEEEIFAALSRRRDFARALETGSLQTFLRDELANAALQTALSYALTPVAEELRQALGLDVLTLRIEIDRPIELRVGKYLVKNLFVTFLLEVGGPEGTKQTIQLAYEVASGFRVGAQVDSEEEFRLTAEWSTRF